MATGYNYASRPHHPPGNPNAVTKHQAGAQGYAVADGASTVKVDLRGSKTGMQRVPGLVRKGKL